MELGQGRVRLGVRKRFFTEMVEQAPQDSYHGPKSVRVKETLGQCSESHGSVFGWSIFVESGVAVSDPCESLPTQDNSMIQY